MNLSRRGLLGMFAAGAGAAIITPGVIMPIKPRLVSSSYDLPLGSWEVVNVVEAWDFGRDGSAACVVAWKSDFGTLHVLDHRQYTEAPFAFIGERPESLVQTLSMRGDHVKALYSRKS